MVLSSDSGKLMYSFNVFLVSITVVKTVNFRRKYWRSHFRSDAQWSTKVFPFSCKNLHYGKHWCFEVSQLHPPPARGPHTVSTGLRLCNGWSVSMANEGLVCGRASEPPTRFSSFPHCTQQTQPSPETQHKLLPCVSSCCLDILDTVTRYCAVRWNNASCGCMETSVELPRRVEVLQATGPNIALITWI